ncbi:hypothetical protein PYCCODRAFT_1363850 [Trametes coccinea BRFM310]|uniref:SET domain-containing protein n=1 Tax=Trametes coccinea (strain BRFM310) TaxID=1353009 RepID=A0A1Y2IU65_TRAC3|nr:hypothetical protein PYCCODRAFT_1363850 [Trametes coccinea BRFM310]
MDPDQLAALASGLRLDSQSSPRTQPSPRAHGPPPRYHHGMSAEEVTRYLKEYAEWFEEDRKIPPEPATIVDRNQLIADQRQRRAQLERMAHESARVGGAGIPFYMTMVGFPKHSSSTALQNLRPITFSGMLVRRVHLGHYLLCRLVAPCTRMVAVQTVVEDTEGIAHDLSIYNFPSTSNCSLEHLDALFPPGTILAIREPTLKAPTQGSRPLLRVDSPTDIIFVARNSPLLQNVSWRTGVAVAGFRSLPATADAWQQRGNDHFKASQWFLAAFAYSHALVLDHNAIPLRLNRAEAYLRQRYYTGALYDAQQVLAEVGVSDTFADKALLRVAKARYGRQEYNLAQEAFVRYKNKHVGDSSVDSWLDRCRARLRESSTGIYDWPSLFRTAQRKIRLDAADFVGPVKVRRMKHRGGGRGVVTTKDVKTGELLIVTKPFASVYAPDLPTDQLIVTLDLISKTTRERTDSLLLSLIVDKLYGNPDLRNEVYHLYSGPDYPAPPETYPPSPSDPAAVDPLDPKVNINIAQLEAICTYNNFCPFRLDGPRVDQEAKPAGLYTFASMFNHSCAANATWYCIGDLMIIRAAESIPAGTEVTIPYCVEESYIDRQTILRKHMLDKCDCRLCEEDRQDGDERLRRRHQLKSRLDADAIMSASLAEVRALEKDIRATYGPTRGPVRPLSALALHVVAEKLRMSGNARDMRDSLQCDMQALECYGFVLIRDSARSPSGSKLPIAKDRIPTVTSFMEPADIMLRIACTYYMLREETNATNWLKATLWLTDVSVGGGKELFMLIHEETLVRMGIQSFAARVL